MFILPGNKSLQLAVGVLMLCVTCAHRRTGNRLFGILLSVRCQRRFCADGMWRANEHIGATDGSFGPKNLSLNCKVSADEKIDTLRSVPHEPHARARVSAAASTNALGLSNSIVRPFALFIICAVARFGRIVQNAWSVAVWVGGRPLQTAGIV